MGQDPALPPDPLRPMPTGASGPEEHDALHQPSTPSLARPMVQPWRAHEAKGDAVT